MVVISKRTMIETCVTIQMKDNSMQFSKSILVPCLCQDIGDNYPSNVRPVFCVATVITKRNMYEQMITLSQKGHMDKLILETKKATETNDHNNSRMPHQQMTISVLECRRNK